MRSRRVVLPSTSVMSSEPPLAIGDDVGEIGVEFHFARRAEVDAAIVARPPRAPANQIVVVLLVRVLDRMPVAPAQHASLRLVGGTWRDGSGVQQQRDCEWSDGERKRRRRARRA